MQFSQKSELKPVFLLPKSAILAIIFPKIKRLRPLPNKVRKITADPYKVHEMSLHD
jgi:hypothetical protein